MPSHSLNTRQWVIPPGPGLVSHHARHALSRRAFMGTLAGAAGAVLGAGLLPTTVLAEGGRRNATPKPTANTVTIGGVAFSLTFFGPGVDASSIWDFNGQVGVAQVQGTGHAQNPDGSEETLLFDTDVRFMSGTYVAVDGHVHRGTFGFI